MIVEKTLATPGVVMFTDDESKVGYSAQVDFVKTEAGGGMHGVVVGGLDPRRVEIPVILALIHKHWEDLGEGRVETFYAVISLWVAGANGKFVGAQELLDSAWA